MKILAIGAHPDDIEFGCYGFLKRKREEGAQVYYLVLTDGNNSMGSNGAIRKSEQEEAFLKSGFQECFLGDFHDGQIECGSHTVEYIEKIFRRIQPDVVLTHFPDDTHQDHRNLSLATLSAARNQKVLLYFRSYSSLRFHPNLIVDIDAHMEEKKEILAVYRSQVEKYRNIGIDFVECMVADNHLCGVRNGVSYAEGFVVDRIVC